MSAARALLLAILTICGGAAAGTAQIPARPIVQTIPATLPVLRLTPETTITEDIVGGSGIGDFAVSPSGKVAIDNHNSQVRVVSPSGSLLRSIGRSGNGPGEFRSWLLLAWLGDTLAVADNQLRRTSFFRAESGALLTTAPYGTKVTLRSLTTVSGRLHAIIVDRAAAMRARPHTPGILFPVLMSSVLTVSTAGVSAPITFLHDSVNEADGFDCDDGKGGTDITSFFPDFGPLVTVLPGPRLVTAVRDSFLLTVRGPASAAPLALIREAAPRLKVSNTLWDSLTAPYRGANGALRCGANIQRPEYVPAIRAMLADERGRLWIEVTRAFGSEMLVLDPQGVGMGRFAMPPHDRSVPWQTRNGRLYLVTADADGLQGISVFRVGLPSGAR